MVEQEAVNFEVLGSSPSRGAHQFRLEPLIKLLKQANYAIFLVGFLKGMSSVRSRELTKS